MTTVVSLVLFFTSDILMLINILLFSTSFHSTKLTDRKFQVIFICFIHLIYAVVFKTYYHEVNSYITFIMVFLFYFRFMIFPAFLNPKFTISFLYLSLFLLTIQSIIKKASLLVLRSIFIVTDLSLIENLPPLTLQFAVFIILILICRQKILKNSKLALSLVSKSTWTLILACFFIMSGLITLLEMNTAKILLQKGLFKFILVLFILTLIVIIASLMLNNILKNHYANNTKILENEINNQITHKKQHESFKKEFYAFKHDYENQMHCISSLIIENKNNEAVSYIDQLHKMPLFKKQQFDTGNSIVDAILSDKYSIAQNHEIAFSCKGSFVPDFNVVDLCTILSNALDNSIEACIKLKNKRKIQVNMKIHKEFQILKISNSCNSISLSENKLPKTTKNNAHKHGYGLINIQSAVLKNLGKMNISCDNNTFSIEISIPIENSMICNLK